MNDVGRYRIVQRIGRGGMAEVLEAVAVGEHGFERRVAIKRLLAPTDADADAAMYARMFLDEARIAARLHHANIVAVLDYGIADGLPFQVLEHVDGIDLRPLIGIAGRPFPIALALHVCVEVGRALAYAHAVTDPLGTPLGLVHRDVTPGNVLVAWSGDVRLTDFGIAFAHGRAEKTLDGTTKGTPLFMAPEQVLGEPIDPRADVFALGCVLHTLVVGASPQAQDDQRFQLIAGGELALSDALPEDVRAIVARATRRDPRARYATASELVAAL
ncbi:MAG: serine/threonine-protein kinase, partial [Proteobacteria bacterium]|nr:serine/threonine-protein kinase [Pseudomonadota bacterium]